MSTRDALERLLEQRRAAAPQQAAEIDARIRQDFSRTCALLVLDLSGFTRLTQRHGIIHFLSIVRHMRQCAEPVVSAHGGRVVKQEADNLFAVFDDAPQAAAAAIGILHAFAGANAELALEHFLQAGIGLGYGEVLLVGDQDVYGHEVNLACKLGEDLAQPGEILATEAAYQRLLPGERAWQALPLTASGVAITAYRLQSES